MNDATRILLDEHRAIASVLHGLKHLARTAAAGKAQFDFPVFRAMIRYIDDFPERLHHPKEDNVLFARLEQRAPEAKPLLEELRAEHERGAALVRDLERKLIAFEDDAGAADAFRQAVDAYARFHWEHMRKEEDRVLPLAERHFTAEDWRALESAFAGNRDPLAIEQAQEMKRLFARIVNLAPAPIGLAEAWKT